MFAGILPIYKRTDFFEKRFIGLAGVSVRSICIVQKNQERVSFEGHFDQTLHPDIIPYILKEADRNHDKLITDDECDYATKNLLSYK